MDRLFDPVNKPSYFLSSVVILILKSIDLKARLAGLDGMTWIGVDLGSTCIDVGTYRASYYCKGL